MNKMEVRSIEPTDAEVRALRRGRTIEGYAIVFNKESRDLGGFKEIILPEAVDGILEQSDVLALLNHNESRGVLARSTNGDGTLELTKTNFGVRYRFDSPETSLGEEVLAGVRRGDIRTSSFSFSLPPENAGEKWEKRSDGTYLRTITKFNKIYDVSPVYREAYADTTVAVRSLVELKTSEAERIAAEAQKKAADLEEELNRRKSPSETTDAPNKPTDPEKEPDSREAPSDSAEVKGAEEVIAKPDDQKVDVKEQKLSYAELEAYYKQKEDEMSKIKEL